SGVCLRSVSRILCSAFMLSDSAAAEPRPRGGTVSVSFLARPRDPCLLPRLHSFEPRGLTPAENMNDPTTPQSRAGAADQGLPADRTDRVRRRLKYGHREPQGLASMLPGVGRTQGASSGPPTELGRTLVVMQEEPRKPRQAAPSALDPRARAQFAA